MKKLTILLLALFPMFFAAATFAAPQRGTAEYYLADPDRHLDKSVSIFVLMASSCSAQAPDKYTAFIASTAGNNNNSVDGGSILIYVRTIRAKKFESDFSTGWIVNGKPRTKQMSGKFIKAVDGQGYAIQMN